MKIVVKICVWAIALGLIYGVYFAAKHLSYSWWYKDAVKQTIRQMVDESALR